MRRKLVDKWLLLADDGQDVDSQEFDVLRRNKLAQVKSVHKKGRFIRQERWSGACSRSFYVGDVKPEDVKARYEHGVLSLSLPKAYTREIEGHSHIAIT